MISPRRTFAASLIGCLCICWAGNVCCQAPANATGNLDAATAASNTTNLPPPAPLPDLPALPAGAGAPPMAPLPPSATGAAAQLPGLPAAAPAPATALPPLPGPADGGLPPVSAGVGMPTLPDSAVPVGGPPGPGFALPADESALPAAVTVVIPDSTPVPVEPQSIVDPMAVHLTGSRPEPQVFPRYETMSLQRHPLPQVTPSSPLIPAASLAETINQNRQKTTLPGSGGDTNYAYATQDNPTGPARPLITPPSIIETRVSSDIGKDYPPLQAVMAPPHSAPTRLDEAESAFGIPTEAENLNYYVSRHLHKNPDPSGIQPYPSMADVIVLRGGQEFQGVILERGGMWRIELTNGTVITVPGDKVTHVRKQLAAPTHAPGVGRTLQLQ